ncbi:MAG: hypothetical protein JW846_11100 [Dehalococcoidia bacterium]|nr:hypothetical protein [Dehalococcoidia bacterium]
MTRRYGLVAVMILLVSVLGACAASDDAAGTPAVAAEEVESATTVEGEAAPSILTLSPVEDEPVPAVSAEKVSHLRLEPEIDGPLMLISTSDAERAGHVHFIVPGPSAALNYLGYMLDGTFYARAEVCPNCGSEGLSFSSNSLSCHSCSSDFNLETGIGGEDVVSHIPAGLVPYVEDGGYFRIFVSDLVEAYERTAAGEEVLFERDVVVEVEEDEDDDVPACCRR